MGRRREGVAEGKKRGLGAGLEKAKPPAPISIGGRSFQGKRAVFGDDDSGENQEAVGAQASQSSKSKKMRSHQQDEAMAKPAVRVDESVNKLPAKKGKLKKKKRRLETEGAVSTDKQKKAASAVVLSSVTDVSHVKR